MTKPEQIPTIRLIELRRDDDLYTSITLLLLGNTRQLTRRIIRERPIPA
jgi:hypothetical protein